MRTAGNLDGFRATTRPTVVGSVVRVAGWWWKNWQRFNAASKGVARDVCTCE